MTPTTSAALPPPPARRITEVKEPLEGVAQEFDLECWLRSDNQAVGRWPAVEGNAFGLLAGGWSWGVWGTQRPYGAYRMHDPGGTLQGYRIDAVSDVRISDAEVRYRDLLLDARITPGGEVTLEDEDEAERAVAEKKLSLREQWALAWVRGVLESRPEVLVHQIDAAIARAVAEVAGGAT